MGSMDTLQTPFEINQDLDRQHLKRLMNATFDFDSLQEIANLGVSISNHHFADGIRPRLEREIDALGLEEALDNYICRIVALEVSEASETLEEGRLANRDFKLLLEEQTDVLIRTLNAMHTLLQIAKTQGVLAANVQIGDFVAAKMAKNIDRPPSHGGKRF